MRQWTCKDGMPQSAAVEKLTELQYSGVHPLDSFHKLALYDVGESAARWLTDSRHRMSLVCVTYCRTLQTII
jgi:hypothetical protein